MQRQNFYSFSAGEQHASTDILMRQNELRTARNADFKKIGGVQKSLGYTTFGATLPTNPNAKVYNYTFNKEDGVTRYVLAVVDNGTNVQIYSSQNGGAWSSGLLATPWTTGQKVRFATFLNRVFIVNGQDAMLSWDGAAANFDTTNCVGAPVAKYITIYKTRIILGNIYTFPQRVAYSTLPVTGVVTWAGFTLDLPTEEGDVVTGFANNNGVLIIFKSRSYFKFDIQTDNTISSPMVSGSVGCTSPDAIKTIGRYTIFPFENTIWMTTGANPMYISEKEAWLMNAVSLDNLGTLFAVTYQNTFYRIYLGNIVPAGYSTFPSNIYLQYDVNMNAWSHGSYADTFVSYATTIINGIKYVLAGTNTNKIMQLDTGYSQNGKAFESFVEFQPFYGNSVDDEKSYIRLHIDGQRLKGLVVTVEVDGNIIENVGGTIEHSFHEYFDIGRIFGHYAKVYVTDNSMKERYLIQSISIDYDARAKDNRSSV